MHWIDLQRYMEAQRIDGWLIYDFRGSNPLLAQLLPGKRGLTRRALLWIPARGEARLATHSIDAHYFEGVGIPRDVYLSWRDLNGWLQAALAGMTRVAMEYAPGGALPVVSIVDGGTLELVRAFGAEVVSSANLVQIAVATWSREARAAHEAAGVRVNEIKDAAFQLIRARVRAGQKLTELDVQQHIMSLFESNGLETPEPPIVAVNEHSGNPHFEVSTSAPAAIRAGDWVLIDLWARKPGDENVFSDITWVGYVGEDPTPRHREVFAVVRGARDAAVERARAAFRRQERVQGWQLDDAARKVIIDAGFERYIRHRTGHSLSPGPKVHGLGVNIDNLETHDTRELLPGLGFTVEPGVYLPEFGVRSEINVFVDPSEGPVLTSAAQEEIILL